MEITCGCDPEVAVFVGNKLVPCVGVIPGTKSDPLPVKGSKVGLKIQEDGVSLEFNLDPCSMENFRYNVALGMEELEVEVKKYFGKTASVQLLDSATFTDEDLKSEQAQTFGCDPDFFAHDRGAMRKRIDPKSMGNVRAFAGHLHVGYDKGRIDNLIPDWAIIQFMEAFSYATQVTAGLDPQKGRRKFYGLAGLYRPKDYGFEYRTPSSFWVNNTRYAEQMFTAAQVVINRPNQARILYDLIDWEGVQSMINDEGDRTKRNSHTKLYHTLTAMYNELASKPGEL